MPARAVTTALDTDQAATIAILVIVGILVIGALISFIITAIVWRVIVIVAVLALAGVVYGQRASIESSAKNCDATFFGAHLTPSSPTVKKHCQQISR